MNIVFFVLATLLGIIVLGVVYIVHAKCADVSTGKELADAQYHSMKFDKMSFQGEVVHLSVLPLIDFYTDDPSLRTEPGVSYLVKADDTTILVDVGFNAKSEHPSPLLHNMTELGISPKEFDSIFISHLHLDHVGGMQEQHNHTFSISRGPVALPEIPVYAPDTLTPSSWNPGPVVQVIREPKLIGPGIASIGVIPRHLFLLGRTEEQSLAVNLKGKGIVLIVGCGHQTVERIIDRTRMIFDEPMYAIIGGLHYPVKGGRMWKGPFNIQRIVGSDRPPWISVTEADVHNAIAAIKREDPAMVALSAHDSCDWSIGQFEKAFGNRFRKIMVGTELTL